MKKYDNFCKALENLRVVQKITEPYDVLTLTGSVALFEICFEQHLDRSVIMWFRPKSNSQVQGGKVKAQKTSP